MARSKLVNGVVVPFTAQEELDRDAEEQVWADGEDGRARDMLRVEVPSRQASAQEACLLELLSDPAPTGPRRELLAQWLSDISTFPDDVASPQVPTPWPGKP